MKHLLCWIALIICYSNLIGQSLQGGWGWQSGWTHTLIADQHTSPLLYQANALRLGGSYLRTGQTQLNIGLQFDVGTNQTARFGARTGTISSNPDIYGDQEFYEITANPFFSFLQGRFFVKSSWQLGANHRLGIAFNARHIFTGMGADNWHYTQLDLSPAYQYYRPIGSNGHLSASVQLPLLAFVVRPNYAFDPSQPDLTNYYLGYIRTGSAFTSVHELVNPTVQLGYHWGLDNGARASLQYRFSWTQYPEPRPMKLMENGLVFNYQF